MFVEEVDDFLFEEFALEHIFDCEFFGVLYFGDYLFYFFGLEDGVWLDDGDGEGEVDLFGVEKGLLH